MGRIHLFEFEDQKWFPAFLRNYGTDFLQYLTNKTGLFHPAIPVLQKGLENADSNTMVDLGSGGGGGLISLNKALLDSVPDLKIILTDYYPNLPAFRYTQSQAKNIEYVTHSIDARNVPKDFIGIRTLFLVFHHFKPSDARQILQNAVDLKQPIAIFEGQERSFKSILAMILSPISVLITTPFIRPFKLGRILFTYLIPIIPLFVLWDGVVSSLRTYSLEEMNQLVLSVQGQETYNWDIARLRSGPGIILYLLGTVKT